MISQRQLFLQHVAQTSDTPLMLEIVEASGITLTDINGKQFIDLISGISVSNLGHRHPKVVQAIKEQADPDGRDQDRDAFDQRATSDR